MSDPELTFAHHPQQKEGKKPLPTAGLSEEAASVIGGQEMLPKAG